MRVRETGKRSWKVVGALSAAAALAVACAEEEAQLEGIPALAEEQDETLPGQKNDVVDEVPGRETVEHNVASESDAGAKPDPSQCTTTITPSQEDVFFELCKPTEGLVRHVRLQGLRTPETHAAAQIDFGFDAPPTGAAASPTATVGADQFRVLFYGGGVPMPPALVQLTFGDRSLPFMENASFLRSTSTVCFDLHDGAVDAPPAFALWVDGEKGADCSDLSTLTETNVFVTRSSWLGAVGVIAKDKNVYYRQSAGLDVAPVITLSSTAALSTIP